MIFSTTTFRVATLWVAALFCLSISGCSGSNTIEQLQIEFGKSSNDTDEFTVTLPPTERDLSTLEPGFWKRVFRVTVDGDSDVTKLSLAGSYRLRENGLLVFTPKFPLNTRIDYRATFEVSTFTGSGDAIEVQVFPGSMPDMAPVVVVSAVYPNASSIPENNLKFYIHFSEPMNRGSSYENLSLVDESGVAVDLPFLELDEELWSHDGTRLTVFIDPGRIKQGLTPHEELGPVLESGRSYTLIVNSGFQDSEGRQLVESYEKNYAISGFDSLPPNMKDWEISPPAIGTLDALEVNLKEHLDHALLHRLIWVNDQSGAPLEGYIETVSEDRIWLFFPNRKWEQGTYVLFALTELSDLAGNSLKGAFETDMTQPDEMSEVAARVEILFQVVE